MRQKLSKVFDMRYWWMKDRIHHRQFNLLWAPGKFNLADYFTKHFLPWHHRKMRYKYLKKLNSVHNTLRKVSVRGCVSSTRLLRHILRAVPHGTSCITLTLELKPMRNDVNHRSQQQSA
jgi:hypothetical protein